MLIDWSNPPRLACPRMKRKRLEMETADRAAVAIPRKGPKNHSVNRERARAAKAKSERIEAKLTDQQRKRAAFQEQVHAFWAGHRDSHP